MKKHLLLIGAIAALLFTNAPLAQAYDSWWPWMNYCNFVDRVEVDKVWQFQGAINGTKEWNYTTRENNLEQCKLVDAPGYIAFNFVTWEIDPVNQMTMICHGGSFIWRGKTKVMNEI